MIIKKDKLKIFIDKITDCDYCRYRSRCNNSGDFRCFKIKDDKIDKVMNELFEIIDIDGDDE